MVSRKDTAICCLCPVFSVVNCKLRNTISLIKDFHNASKWHIVIPFNFPHVEVSYDGIVSDIRQVEGRKVSL